MPNLAFSLPAVIRSQPATKWHPPAMAMACTSAMTHWGRERMVLIKLIGGLKQPPNVSQGLIQNLRAIMPGTKHRSVGLQDDDLHRMPLRRILKASGDLFFGSDPQRIALLGHVQRQHPDFTLFLIQNGLVTHTRSPFLKDPGLFVEPAHPVSVPPLAARRVCASSGFLFLRLSFVALLFGSKHEARKAKSQILPEV